MKIALVTTTINVPQVLRQYDVAAKYTDNQVRMFITGDTISPNQRIKQMMKTITTPWTYLSFQDQKNRWPELSDVIGQRKIQRRNFSYLAAVQDWDPDVIVTVDDDNKPISPKQYFNSFNKLDGQYYQAYCFKNLSSNKSNPFNNDPFRKCKVFHRGYSVKDRASESSGVIAPVGGNHVRYGVLQGIALGDPDVDAITRINCSREQVERQMNQVAKMSSNWSFPFDWVPYNSQNTGFTVQFLPYQFLFPFVGRYDDILASYVAQLIMKHRQVATVFGKPYAVQLRNKHNIMKDLKDQIWGMENIDKIVDEVLQPLSLKKGIDPDNLYFQALTQIKLLCQYSAPKSDPNYGLFDDRNIKAAQLFFEEIRR